jgi:hypothetical protein
MPYSFWGKIKRSIGGWNLSARADADSGDLSVVGLQLQAAGRSTAIQVLGSGSRVPTTTTTLPTTRTTTSAETRLTVAVSSVKLSKNINGWGGKWTFVPRYNVKTSKGDMTVAFALQDTVVAVDVAGLHEGQQKVTVRQQIGPNNQFSPSLTTAGEIELAYRRSIAATGGSVTATIKPDAYVGLKWDDGPWEANLKAPMQGLGKFHDGVKFNIRRTVDVDTL